MFIIHTYSNLFYLNSIIHSLHFVLQQFSHMKLSCFPLEWKLLLIYCMEIPYITDIIPNSSVGHQLSTHAKGNMWIMDINREETITAYVSLDELNCHQNPRGKSKFKISLCRRNIHQRTDLEGISSRFDQIIPVVSHLDFFPRKKRPTPHHIIRGFKGPQRKFWKEFLFVQYDKHKNVSLILSPIQI